MSSSSSPKAGKKKVGRPYHPHREAVRLLWMADPMRKRQELADIAGVSRQTVQLWISQWKVDDPMASREWLAVLRSRVAGVIEQGLARTFAGMDEASAAQAWQIVAGAMKAGGIDAPERTEHRETRRIEFVVKHEDSALDGKTEVEQP